MSSQIYKYLIHYICVSGLPRLQPEPFSLKTPSPLSAPAPTTPAGFWLLPFNNRTERKPDNDYSMYKNNSAAAVVEDIQQDLPTCTHLYLSAHKMVASNEVTDTPA